MSQLKTKGAALLPRPSCVPLAFAFGYLSTLSGKRHSCRFSRLVLSRRFRELHNDLVELLGLAQGRRDVRNLQRVCHGRKRIRRIPRREVIGSNDLSTWDTTNPLATVTNSLEIPDITPALGETKKFYKVVVEFAKTPTQN